MHVVVEFGAGEGPGLEGDGMDFAVVTGDREDSGDGVVGGVSLDSDLSIRNPVVKDGGLSKSLFEILEGGSCGVRENPRNAFAREASERNSDFGIAVNKTSIKVAETKK